MKEIIELTSELESIKFIFPKILVATICGSIIGWERERRNKVAGLRTNVLICVGSAIFTVASFWAAKEFNSDPTRILSTIVTGIGFIGGGVIMKEGLRITGMTTAAFIWVISAVGILCGMGLIISPIILTLGLVIVSNLLGRVEDNMKKNKNV